MDEAKKCVDELDVDRNKIFFYKTNSLIKIWISEQLDFAYKFLWLWGNV